MERRNERGGVLERERDEGVEVRERRERLGGREGGRGGGRQSKKCRIAACL